MEEVELVRSLFPEQLRFLWYDKNMEKYHIREIRIRMFQPIILLTQLGEKFLDERGNIVDESETQHFYKITQEEFSKLLSYLCRESVYAYMEEMKRGYLTVRGGHRIGIAGELYQTASGEIAVRNVRSLNIRIAREVVGAANNVLPFLLQQKKFQNTLLISPPGQGKTTILRDLIRQLSDGNQYIHGMKVGVVDERYELMGNLMEEESNHLGKRTDILSGCLKTTGIMSLLRSMSPEIIAVDEIGSREDEQVLCSAIYCGCGLLATMHGDNRYNEVMKKKLDYYMKHSIFTRYVFLGKKGVPGTIDAIYTEKGQCIYESENMI